MDILSSSPTTPLVSCLCVTHNEAKLKRAIQCYLNQSYPNKELVLVHQGSDIRKVNAIKGLHEEFTKHNVRLTHIPQDAGFSLGELRNISVREAMGEYICQWDDDDWSHPERIRIQMQHAVEFCQPVTVLTNILLFDEVIQQSYLSAFRIWEPTMLMRREIFDEKIKYPQLNKKEDTAFVNLLLQESRIYPIVRPDLYIYTYHGNNTWDRSHFDSMFGRSQKLGNDSNLLIGNILSERPTLSVAEHTNALLALYSQLNVFYEDKLLMASPSTP